MNKILVFLLIFSSPLYVVYYKAGGGPITFFRLVFAVSAITVPFTLLKRRARFDNRLLFFALGFIVAYTISWMRIESGFFKRFADARLISIYMFFGTVAIVCNLIRTEKMFWFALKALIFTSVCVCVFNVLNYFLIKHYSINLIDYTDSGMTARNFLSEFGCSGVRLSGTFFDANVFGIYILSSVVICLYFLNNYVMKYRKLLKLILVFLIINLALTFSRSAITLLAMNFLAISIYIRPKARSFSNIILRRALHVILLALPFFYFGDYFFGLMKQRVAGLENEIVRILRAKGGIEAFFNSPIIGNGMYEYGVNLPIVSVHAPTTHSLYLDILADTGLFGAFFFAGFVFSLILMLVKISRSYNSTLYKFMLLILFNILAFQITYSSFFNPTFAVQFGVIISLVIGFNLQGRVSRKVFLGDELMCSSDKLREQI